MPLPNRPRSTGFTLIEFVAVLALTAVLVGTAAPAFQELRQRRQLEGVAMQLSTDLQMARAEAVSRNESVRVAFSRDALGSCYVLHTGPAGGCRCDGSGLIACSADAVALRHVARAAGDPVQVQSNSSSVLFDAVKGTVTPTASVRVDSPLGQIRQIVNVMGRVRTCTPDAGVIGVRPC